MFHPGPLASTREAHLVRDEGGDHSGIPSSTLLNRK